MRLPAAAKDREDNKADRSKHSSISSHSSDWRSDFFVPSAKLKNFLWRFRFTLWQGKLYDNEGWTPLQRASREACNNGSCFRVIEELIDNIWPADLDTRTPKGPNCGQPAGWAPVHFLAEAVNGTHFLQRLAYWGACITAAVEGIFLIHIYIYIYIYINIIILHYISYHMNTPTYYKIGPTNIDKEVGLICPTHLSPASTQPHSLASFNAH